MTEFDTPQGEGAALYSELQPDPSLLDSGPTDGTEGGPDSVESILEELCDEIAGGEDFENEGEDDGE